jgi:carbonic anhydrase/acetyltransferase-like protein (isoleucine patch superfamily)
MNKKYSLTKTTKQFFGTTLYQIKAEVSFGMITKGELGGYIEKEENLDHEGNAWVYGNAWVSGDARVYGNAQVSGDAWVYGNARVYGDAWVYGNARVYGNAWVYGNARVYGNAWVSGDALVSGDAQVSGDAVVTGNAVVSAKALFTKGLFIGGDNSGKISDITAKTGSNFLQNQYVLGDYEITPIEEDKVERVLLSNGE